MVRYTQHHQFPVPEPSDPDYAETFDELIDEIDVEVLLKGTIDNRPLAGVEGRWYLSTDEDPPALYYDDGAQWTSPAFFGDPPETMVHRNEATTMTEQVTFEEPIDGDILGDASFASEAGEAQVAEDTRKVAGHTEDDFARTDRDETFDGAVEFLESVDAAGVNVMQGTVGLARYSGTDPTHSVGDLWMRTDRQP